METFEEIRDTRKWYEEGVIQIAMEAVCREMQKQGCNDAYMANMLDISERQFKNLLSGRMECSLRMLGAMAWVLKYEIKEENFL